MVRLSMPNGVPIMYGRLCWKKDACAAVEGCGGACEVTAGEFGSVIVPAAAAAAEEAATAAAADAPSIDGMLLRRSRMARSLGLTMCGRRWWLEAEVGVTAPAPALA